MASLNQDVESNAAANIAAVEDVKQRLVASEATQQSESDALRAEVAAVTTRLEDVHAKAEELAQAQTLGESGVREEFAATKEHIKAAIQKIAAAVKERGEEMQTPKE